MLEHEWNILEMNGLCWKIDAISWNMNEICFKMDGIHWTIDGISWNTNGICWRMDEIG